jgi:hypothetical protein
VNAHYQLVEALCVLTPIHSHVSFMHKESLFANRVVLSGTAVSHVVVTAIAFFSSSSVFHVDIIARKEGCKYHNLSPASKCAAAFLPRLLCPEFTFFPPDAWACMHAFPLLATLVNPLTILPGR